MKLPSKVDVIEVGPRDGFQNIQEFIKTEDKIDIIKKLIDSGVKHIEVTSFVHPKWVPQMRDATEVVSAIKEYIGDRDVELIALVPNKKGALNAYKAGIDTITYVISASESHNLKNVNRTIEQSFEELSEIVDELKEMKFRLAIATTFGCPFNEEVPSSKVIEMIKRGFEMGASKVLLADTVGMADPLYVKKMLSDITKEIDTENLVLHLHDTRGMGLANTLVALEHNFTTFETSIGGLGGCPFAPGAAGNIGTEDLVNMLHQMNIETTLVKSVMNEALDLVRDKVDAPLMSHMSQVTESCN